MANEKVNIEQQASGQEAQPQAPKSPIVQWIEANKNLAIGGGVALVAAIVAILFFTGVFSGSEDEASAAMYRASLYFEQDSLKKALKGDGKNLGFEAIADEYSGTDAANLAKYYAGVANLKEGKLDAGIENLESFSKGENVLSFAAYMALGFAYEDKGDVAKATSAFKKASEAVDANEQTTPVALMHAARCYETQKEYGNALEIYQRIKREFPTTTEGATADKYIARAEALQGN